MKSAAWLPFRSSRSSTPNLNDGFCQVRYRPFRHQFLSTSPISLQLQPQTAGCALNTSLVVSRAQADARHFVGERSRYNLIRPASEQRSCPLCCRGLAVAGKPQHGMCPDDEKAPKVGIALFGNVSEAFLAAARALPRHESDPGRQFPARSE